jgi:hypothetical protein
MTDITPQTTAPPGLTDWLHIVQAEYLEMPGLQLTKPQIRRLWGIEEATCDALLAQLLQSQFLRRTPRDEYVLDGTAC